MGLRPTHGHESRVFQRRLIPNRLRRNFRQSVMARRICCPRIQRIVQQPTDCSQIRFGLQFHGKHVITVNKNRTSLPGEQIQAPTSAPSVVAESLISPLDLSYGKLLLDVELAAIPRICLLLILHDHHCVV